MIHVTQSTHVGCCGFGKASSHPGVFVATFWESRVYVDFPLCWVEGMSTSNPHTVGGLAVVHARHRGEVSTDDPLSYPILVTFVVPILFLLV